MLWTVAVLGRDTRHYPLGTDCPPPLITTMARYLLLLLVLVTALHMVAIYQVEAAFELACMEKCLKTRRCKKYGQFTFDFDCDKQCKKKCFKIKT